MAMLKNRVDVSVLWGPTYTEWHHSVPVGPGIQKQIATLQQIHRGETRDPVDVDVDVCGMMNRANMGQLPPNRSYLIFIYLILILGYLNYYKTYKLPR